MESKAGQEIRAFHIFLVILYILSFISIIYFFYKGWDYYSTPFPERPRHDGYTLLKPGGDYGHGFGIIGSLMMLVMLLYSIRKRSQIFSKLGNITKWLDIHIYLGIFGPLLIILHSSFKVYGLVAISFYSMLAVALSGIIGRYLYLQIPHNIQGHELSLLELKNMDTLLSEKLKTEFDFSDEMISKLEHLTKSSHLESRNSMVFLVKLLLDDIYRARVFRKFKKENAFIKKLPPKQVKDLVKIARNKVILHRRILALNKIQQIFHYWHVIHKPFAIIMIIIMFVHIAIAITFGYKWIF